MFYQLIIQQFGIKRSIVFDEPIDIERCIYHALIEEELSRKNNCDSEDINHHNIKNNRSSSDDDRITLDTDSRDDDVMISDGIDDDVRHDIREQTSIGMRLLRSKASILDEYFAIRIDITTGCLISLPCILPEYLPIPEELPGFLLDLCTEVIWDIEIDCFRSIALILATYYSKLPVINYSIDDDDDHGSGRVPTTDDDDRSTVKQSIANSKASQLTAVGVDLLSNYIYPALRIHLKPHKSRHTDNTVMQIAALEQLYKVFERC
jgi:DNA mismatch repair protein MLH1